ncbi:hypothetical protein JQC67_16230 [Aurantibacter crassamenti]|uniref:DUF6786 family protein n=1 Tax=Aurantibacter crassamenti TaxID=1837375 RepID=UPI001939DF8D|nr:DUF6786 family protein [Aurantibacter crassamenti]MBM1107705.1 hypothetical protein [Aurantibacter crassamenti]
MKKNLNILIVIFMSIVTSNGFSQNSAGNFENDFQFLKKHQEVVLLKSKNNKSQLIVLPKLQGRVMTSTANGLKGNSYGWMHYELLASGQFEEHMNAFGGEDRFWMGPEGGQYSIFFKKGTDFTFDNWYTPKEIDTETYEIVNQTDTSVSFRKKMILDNYNGYRFDIEVNRIVTIFDNSQIAEELAIDLTNVETVGFQSANEIVNTGKEKWSKNTGLLSIWILGMFNPSEKTTVILPYKNELALNTSYFGEIPPERLTITDKHVLFKGNGTKRFKMGVPPQNVMPYIGSYDADKNVLTIVSYSFENDTTYVNSEWKIQDNPYAGDVINSYNDGPLENGEQLGPFYEMESSSSTRELLPKESIKHIHKTYHFEGDKEALNDISKKLLKLDLSDL